MNERFREDDTPNGYQLTLNGIVVALPGMARAPTARGQFVSSRRQARRTDRIR